MLECHPLINGESSFINFSFFAIVGDISQRLLVYKVRGNGACHLINCCVIHCVHVSMCVILLILIMLDTDLVMHNTSL